MSFTLFYFQRTSVDLSQSFYDTAGWKNLETSLKALQYMIEGCGSHFHSFMDEELIAIILKTLTHSNRFVRETGFYLCSSLFLSINSENGMYSFGVRPFLLDNCR